VNLHRPFGMAAARQGLPVRLDRAPQRGAAFALTRAFGVELTPRAKDRADAGQASKRSPIGDSPRHKRCNRSLS
jgi:hypothetical protein